LGGVAEYLWRHAEGLRCGDPELTALRLWVQELGQWLRMRDPDAYRRLCVVAARANARRTSGGSRYRSPRRLPRHQAWPRAARAIVRTASASGTTGQHRRPAIAAAR
jgi:hypothetical protein